MDWDVKKFDYSAFEGSFKDLRSTPWTANFVWLSDHTAAARQINSYHEDYPQRITATSGCIRWVVELARSRLQRNVLLDVNERIFPEVAWSGSWRKIQVFIGSHVPPSPLTVPSHMDELRMAYPPYGNMTINQLVKWYWDMKTIHPFQDGNGRVGGVIVAALSHLQDREHRWLTACQ